MNSQKLAIIFDGNSGNILYAGQRVTGHVHVQTSERIKIRGIRLEMSGKGKTSWTERSVVHDADSVDDETRYSGREKYMNLEIYLIGSRHDSAMYLDPNVYKYPFSFVLPAELPQSFGDEIGHIRYKAKAVIDRPMRIDVKTEVQFTVIHLLDLNREPLQLREPLVLRRQAPVSGCCCVDGFTEINVTINRGCFVPGETMRFDGEIVNRTNCNIQHSTITLFQTIEYGATKSSGQVYHTKHSTTTLAKLERPFIQRGHIDSLHNISFVVPRVLSSRHDGIIKIKHSVEISAIFNELFGKSSVSCPIVIGNIPLRNEFQPSIVTSQPMGYPAPSPYNMAVGYLPPADVPSINFNTPGFNACNFDCKDLPEVHTR